MAHQGFRCSGSKSCFDRSCPDFSPSLPRIACDGSETEPQVDGTKRGDQIQSGIREQFEISLPNHALNSIRKRRSPGEGTDRKQTKEQAPDNLARPRSGSPVEKSNWMAWITPQNDEAQNGDQRDRKQWDDGRTNGSPRIPLISSTSDPANTNHIKSTVPRSKSQSCGQQDQPDAMTWSFQAMPFSAHHLLSDESVCLKRG